MHFKHQFKSLTILSFLIMSFSHLASGQTYLPYHYWTMDGVNPLKDSMNNYDLDPGYYSSPYTIQNASNASVGKSFSLNSSTGLVLASDALPLDSGFTAEFLFKPSDNINETVVILTRRDNAVTFRFMYAKFRFTTKIIPTASTTEVSENFDISLEGIGRKSYGYYTDGNWHHLVFKYNAKTGVKQVWVDGQLPDGFSDTVAVTGKFNTNPTNPNLNMCNLSSITSYQKYEGYLDEFAIYTYALPNNMIYKHYNEFLQKKHYSFSNSTVVPPIADPVLGDVDIMEYGPGHPAVMVDAVSQLQSFPTPRYKSNHTLHPNVPVFHPSYLGGYMVNQTQSDAVKRSKVLQQEFVTNYNYTLMVSGNTHNINQFGDTNTFEGAWIKMGNQNPSWKTSANSYWTQINPQSIGRVPNDNYVKCGCLPPSSYLRNSLGQYIDPKGNLATGKNISPEAPTDSIRYDGLTMRFYLSKLFDKMTRPLDIVFENGEMLPHWNINALTADPVVNAAFLASGLDAHNYSATKMKKFTLAYLNEFKSLPQMANTRFEHYQIGGHPTFNFEYSIVRDINTPLNGQFYSTSDIYTGNPRNWRYNSGFYNGWQFVVDSRYEEIKLGDSLFSPTVSPGWSNDEERFVRPGQWLGLLKSIAMTGAEYFHTGYFVLTTPFQLPENYVWEMIYPPLAQAVTSRYEDILRNGHLMAGDVPNSVTNTTQPGYSFKAGDFRKLVVARKHNTLNKYAITGTIQTNSNMKGASELTGEASIDLDGQKIKFNIRRQGSTYIYDKTNPSAPVFYQLDGWHEYEHPYYWSKSFDLEAELYDATTGTIEIKTKVPAGTIAGDYTNYTSFVSYKTAGSIEFNFQPRGTSPTTHYLWVKARSTDGSAQSINVSLDGTINKTIGCIQDTNWVWYRYDASSNSTIAFNNLSLESHKLVITSAGTKVEIDKVTVTPIGGSVYTTGVALPCVNGGSGVAAITTSGNTTICQGESVTLTASAGTNYLWSTGATTKSISVTTSGVYGVTVSVGATIAVSPLEVVNVNPLPSNNVTASGPLSFCQGGSVVLTSSSTTGYYLWSNGATTRSITVDTTGSYTVNVTSLSSCSSVSAPKVVTLNTVSVIPATITPSGSTTFCIGGSVDLTANTGSDYLWSNGATMQTITVTTTGNYSVTVTNSSGCESNSPVTVVTANAAPSNGVTASGPLTFCNGGSVVLTAVNTTGSYLWTPGGATTRSITVIANGNYSVVVTAGANCSVTSPVSIVTVNNGSSTPATITPSGATTFCQGGSVSLTATLGSSYLWNNGGTTRTLNATVNGNYSVIVSNASGCTSVSPVTIVTVSPAPSNLVNASGPLTFCNGGSVTLTASNSTGAYLWSNGATTRSITASISGNYSVVVTGTGNCSSTSAVFTVSANGSSVPATITPSSVTNFCQGGSVGLTATLGVSYLWNNGATTRTLNATATGNYSVIVTFAGGCTSSSSVTPVTVNPLPSNAVTASGPLSFCNGGSLTLTATNATGSYLWSNGATSRSVAVNTTGAYSLVITGAGNCSATSSVINVSANGTPTPVSITASGVTTFCQGGSVNLTATAGASYLWSNGATTRTVNANTTGNYIVTVNNSSGCPSASSITPVVVNLLPSNVVNASGSLIMCNGNSVTLTAANSTGSYLWSNGATSRSITVNTAGSYVVTVTSSNCSSTSASNVVTVTNSTIPVVTTSGSTSFCSGGSITLTSTLANNYLWSNGATTRSIIATASGSYLVTVNSGTGCSSTSSAIVITATPAPVINLSRSGPLAFCAGGSVTMSVPQVSGQSYLWFKNGQAIPGTNFRSFTAANPGGYKVRVQQNGCAKHSGTLLVTVPCREGETLPVDVSELEVNVYPNPFSTQTTISFILPSDDQVSVKVYDMDGRLVDVLVDQAMYARGIVEVNYDATDLNKGMYVAVVTTSHATKAIKISSLK